MASKSRPNRPASVSATNQMALTDVTDAAGAKSSNGLAVASIGGLLVRLTWLLVGPFVLFVILYGIAISPAGWISALDGAYFVLVGVVVVCRWSEQRSGHGTTAYGEPSTWADFQRYVRILLPLAGAAWLAANLYRNHVFFGVGVG